MQYLYLVLNGLQLRANYHLTHFLGVILMSSRLKRILSGLFLYRLCYVPQHMQQCHYGLLFLSQEAIPTKQLPKTAR